MGLVVLTVVLLLAAVWAYDRRERRRRGTGSSGAGGDRVDRDRDAAHGWSYGNRYPGGAQGPGAGGLSGGGGS